MRSKFRISLIIMIAVGLLLLISLGVYLYCYLYFRGYADQNGIEISEYEGLYDIEGDNRTQEQINGSGAANRLYVKISAEDYDWFGTLYYNFDTNQICVGLTENTEEHQQQILTHAGTLEVVFFECSYSYQYLKEIYEEVAQYTEEHPSGVSGVESYNISMDENRVVVRVRDTGKYMYASLLAKSVSDVQPIKFYIYRYIGTDG